MTETGSLAAWEPEIAAFVTEAEALCLGLFDTSGTILSLNTGMRLLLGGSLEATPALDNLIMPTLAALCALPVTPDEVIYHGWLTFWGPALTNRSLRGEVRRREDTLLVLAEYDVEELDRINHDVVSLNSEITNLQRELTRQNATLTRALAELKETQAMLVHSEKMNAMGQLVAGVAHEINTPIAFVIGNFHNLQATLTATMTAYTRLESLVQAQGNQAQQDAAGAIRHEADLDFLWEDLDDLIKGSLNGLGRVKKIVESLRTFSRLDEAEWKEVDLLENIQSTLAIAQSQLQDRVTVTLDCADLPPITCYPAELNQVFLNIILNAAQAIAGEGTVTIRGRVQGDTIVLEFADTGKGMTPDVLARVFDPFFTTKAIGVGTGLGLTIAYKIITQRHRGTIKAESTPDAGSTFIITLPLESNHAHS